jgi:transposase-like protein
VAAAAKQLRLFDIDGDYPNEESALKIVYMAIREASGRWTMPVRHWKQALNHFAILYVSRMPQLTMN